MILNVFIRSSKTANAVAVGCVEYPDNIKIVDASVAGLTSTAIKAVASMVNKAVDNTTLIIHTNNFLAYMMRHAQFDKNFSFSEISSFSKTEMDNIIHNLGYLSDSIKSRKGQIRLAFKTTDMAGFNLVTNKIKDLPGYDKETNRSYAFKNMGGKTAKVTYNPDKGYWKASWKGKDGKEKNWRLFSEHAAENSDVEQHIIAVPHRYTADNGKTNVKFILAISDPNTSEVRDKGLKLFKRLGEALAS